MEVKGKKRKKYLVSSSTLDIFSSRLISNSRKEQKRFTNHSQILGLLATIGFIRATHAETAWAQSTLENKQKIALLRADKGYRRAIRMQTHTRFNANLKMDTLAVLFKN